mgnify:CR=1 FL=1
MHTDGPPRNPEDTPEHRVSTYLQRNDQVDDTQVTRLHGDASSRAYFRISRRRARPIVLVVHPGPFAPETLPQLTVGTVFTRLGITIPTVLDHAGDLGVLAVEDLGDETLQDWLAASGEDPTPLYREAINIIATLQRCGKTLDTETGPPFDTAFDVSKLHWELAFFQSEFLGAHRRVILNNATATALDREFHIIAEELADQVRQVTGRTLGEPIVKFTGDKLEGLKFRHPLYKQHSLAEIIAPDQFKSYDELKVKLERALGITGTVSTATAETIADDNSAENVATADDVPWSDVSVTSSAKQEDSSLSYFEKLANDA